MRPATVLRSALRPALIAGLLLVPVSVAAAQAGEGWSQFQGGPTHPGAVPTGPEPPFELDWQAPAALGGPRQAYGLSAPVIADGLAIAVGAEEVLAVDAATGAPAWSVERDLGPSVPAAVVRSTADDLVIFTEGWGSGPPETRTASPGAEATPSPSPSAQEPQEPNSHLTALSLDDQTVAWSVELPAVSRTGVTAATGLAVVATIDGTVVATDVEDGGEAWTAEAGGPVLMSAAIADDLVVVAVQGSRDRGASVVALRVADGSEAWRFEPQPPVLDVGTPSIDPDAGLLFVAWGDASVRALALADGSQRWSSRLNAPPIPAPPAIASERLIVVDQLRGHVFALDPASGERDWDHALNVPTFRAAPVVAGDAVLVPDIDGQIATLDLATGDLTSRSSLATSPLRSVVVTADQVVAVRAGSDAGLIGAVHDPDGVLVREPSPTLLDPAALVVGWLGAAATAAILFLVGRPVWERLGRHELPSSEDEMPEGEGDA